PTNFVSIDYSIDNGQNWLEIIASRTNNGSYSWTIPNTVSTQCMIRVKARDDASVFGLSDVFTIAPPFITITSPVADQVLPGCGTHQITWEQEGLQSYVKVYYSVDGGNTWVYVAEPYVGSNNYYNWTIPSSATDKFKVKVEDS